MVFEVHPNDPNASRRELMAQQQRIRLAAHDLFNLVNRFLDLSLKDGAPFELLKEAQEVIDYILEGERHE